MHNYRIIAVTALAMATAFSSAALGQETRPGAASGSVKNVVAQVVDEPAGSSASVLLTRQGQRLDLLETDLRDMRGILETDVRNLKMQITQLGNNASSGETATTAEIRDLRDQIERLADAVAMTSRRMERTLEMTSDMEFRLLRMEKRLQTLMNLGGDELARAAVQDDTIPAGDGGQVAMSRDADTGEVVWQMSESELNKQLDGNENAASGAAQSTDLASLAAQPEDSTIDASPQTVAGNGDNASETAGLAAVASARGLDRRAVRRELVDAHVAPAAARLPLGREVGLAPDRAARPRHLGCHSTRYVPNARGWYAYPVRTVRGALGASRPVRPVRTNAGGSYA